MSVPPALPPPLPAPAPSPSLGRTLRRLFLTLFLRGRGSRGLAKASAAPRSVGSKLAVTLGIYVLVGMLALAFLRQPVFALGLYLHAMTLMFLGMFVAASAGEVLFNKEEADILMHRPVFPRALLWAKISVLVQVSLWLAGAFNLTGLLVGMAAADGGWLFPLVHAGSTVLQALFCTSSVVLVYQLCLRWFGRERLDGLMTGAQVLMTVAIVFGSQLVPQLIGRVGGKMSVPLDAWWIWLLPPAWFAGVDDALAGSRAASSWALAVAGLLATVAVLWLAFGKLARDYEAGVQMLNETVSAPRLRRARRRWLDVIVHAPPLCWWLRDPVVRASFLLTAAYLIRDRDVKLRVYPGIAPMLVMPLIFLIRGKEMASFGVGFAGAYLGLIPLMGLNLLQYSQHWQASDVFRAAPMPGPAPLCHGARRAVLFVLTVPALIAFALILGLAGAKVSQLALLVPGLVAIPLIAMVPCLGGKAVPLSQPVEEAKSAGRGLHMLLAMMASFGLSGLALWSWSGGWFHWLLLAETVLVGGLYLAARASITAARWGSME